MLKKNLLAATLISGLAATGLAAADAKADVGAKFGTLTCTLTDSNNMVVYTDQKFACEFSPTEGAPESYTGQISSIGLDLQITKDMTLVWVVLAPTDAPYKPGALKGTYVGASASAALGGGGGAKLLVGGGDDSFTLQPLSVSGVTGAGASVGIQSFELS